MQRGKNTAETGGIGERRKKERKEKNPKIFQGKIKLKLQNKEVLYPLAWLRPF